MAKTQPLVFKHHIKAPVAEVYRAFTNSTVLRMWLCDVALADPRKGGRWYVAWNDGYYAAGEFVSAIANKKAVFTWLGRNEPAATRVQVAVTEKDGGAALTLTHSGFGSGKAWAKTLKQHTRGWEVGLRNLKSVLEAGPDLRIALRPMLGIMLGVFDGPTAERLGVPVTDGVRLDDTLEGMGARAAGLAQDDVIVSLGGRKVNVNTLGAALQGRQAGDTLPVKFYRGAELRTVKMTLSHRQLPEIPATAAELSQRVAATNAELDAVLEKCFEGVTEAEASFKTAPTEWSAKDVVCHLLAGERDSHSNLAETIWGIQRYYDSFGDNVNERHVALMAVFSTYRQLLDEYRRAQAETVALLASMPEAVVARKGDWWQLCFGWLQPPVHNHNHFEQIRKAIAAARQT